MKTAFTIAAAMAMFVSPIAWAHESATDHPPAVVIDTDLGLDDAVTLALALQSPDVEITAVIACAGAAGRETCVASLERLLHRFNRGDIALYAAAPGADLPAPPFRPFAEASVRAALPIDVAPRRQPFTADAYTFADRKTTVLILGPLTNLAAALHSDPDIGSRIAEVIVAGDVNGWNVAFDQEAWSTVTRAGVPLHYVDAGSCGHKPESWTNQHGAIGSGPSVAAGFLRMLFADPQVRSHYLERFERFHDELTFFYLLNPHVFAATQASDAQAYQPQADRPIENLFEYCVRRGRQRKTRVVFANDFLPETAFRPDVRERRTRILAAHGTEEWFAQLLMNELHDHLGAYSIIGVKMGLRAAELLNAPRHDIVVVSHAPPNPPVSCLNDGLIVATGATPGRGLFSHEPDATGPVRATFRSNGRSITLALKPTYRAKIQAEIGKLRKNYGLEDAAYWQGVRRFGLGIWEMWSREDLFEVIAMTDA